MSDMDSIDIEYIDESKQPDRSNAYDGISDDKLRQPEKNAVYLERVGLLRLRDVPEKDRTKALCIEAMRLHPEDFPYIPENVKDEIPESDLKQYEEKYKQTQDYQERHEEEVRRERYYRDTTGDYNHDGRVNETDKRLERNGDQYLGIY